MTFGNSPGLQWDNLVVLEGCPVAVIASRAHPLSGFFVNDFPSALDVMIMISNFLFWR